MFVPWIIIYTLLGVNVVSLFLKYKNLVAYLPTFVFYIIFVRYIVFTDIMNLCIIQAYLILLLFALLCLTDVLFSYKLKEARPSTNKNIILLWYLLYCYGLNPNLHYLCSMPVILDLNSYMYLKILRVKICSSICLQSYNFWLYLVLQVHVSTWYNLTSPGKPRFTISVEHACQWRAPLFSVVFTASFIFIPLSFSKDIFSQHFKDATPLLVMFPWMKCVAFLSLLSRFVSL